MVLDKMISLCIPCMNRVGDLKVALPKILEIIDFPVEIAILNYGSKDDLDDYIKTINYEYLTYHKVEKEYFHMADAKNTAVKKSNGDIVVVSGCDVYFKDTFFKTVRDKMEDYDWLNSYGWDWKSVAICKRKLFDELGGYDKRFELYGPDDKDFNYRLIRSHGKMGFIDKKNFFNIPTDYNKQISNYSIKVDKRRMRKKMEKYFLENIENHIIKV